MESRLISPPATGGIVGQSFIPTIDGQSDDVDNINSAKRDTKRYVYLFPYEYQTSLNEFEAEE